MRKDGQAGGQTDRHDEPNSMFSQFYERAYKLHMELTFRLSDLHGTQNKERPDPYTALTGWVCMTEVESIYCAVRNESLYKTDNV